MKLAGIEHTCNLSTQEAKTGKLGVPGQPELHRQPCLEKLQRAREKERDRKGEERARERGKRRGGRETENLNPFLS